MDSHDAHLHFSTWDLAKTVARFIRPYRWKFWLGTFFRLSSDILWLYPAYAIAQLVTFFSHYSPGQSIQAFWNIIVLLSIVSIYHSIAHHVAKYLCFQTAERISLDSELEGIKHLFNLDISWHDRENAGNKLKRLQNGGQGLEDSVRMWITNVIEIMVNFVGMIFIITVTDRFTGGLMIVFLITYFIISFSMVRRATAAAAEVNQTEEDLHGLFFEGLNNIRSVKAMAMAPALLSLIHEVATRLFKKVRERIFWFQSRGAVLMLWGWTFRIAVFSYIGYGISHGQYQVGFLILFHGYFSRLWESVSELSDISQNFIVARFGVGRMMAILNEPVRIDDESGKIDFSAHWKTVHLQHLTFAYGTMRALDDVTLDIQRGERIGIVGLSGAGKSTLLKLMLKEDESYDGEILFDHNPLRTLKKSSYFQKVAVVLQETEVFNFTLRDNITIANPSEAHNEELLALAIEVAHVSDFLHKLPRGLDTKIGEKGIRLSGGEKQRVGIARAIFKRPQILLLDEATSHLDLESEEKIRDSLHQFFETVTAVVIAHRLTTIREMDRIFVIENGRIMESGSFDELRAKRGRFFELWEKQKL